MRLSKEEIIRRHKMSVINMKDLEREAAEEWYQELCDTMYWKEGQCCAGCDYWVSAHSLTGECRAGPMVSSDEVMKSIGVKSCTKDMGPGYPMSKAIDWCGNFRDEFEWSHLDFDYLCKIGAVDDDGLRSKPERNSLMASLQEKGS